MTEHVSRTKVRPLGGSIVDLDHGDRNEQAMVRACWLYYMEGRTQEQIARELGLNRIRVNRMLSAARENGLVQVRISSKLTSCVELENALRGEYGVAEAIVTPSPIDPANVRQIVASEGGRILSERLHNDIAVAIGWGRTLRYSLNSMERRVIPGMEVVSLTGGLTRGSMLNSYEAALRMADMFGANCSYVAGPAFTDTEETRSMLLRQPIIVDAFRHARDADIAYLSVGGLDMEASMAQLGLIGPEDIATLEAAGAVGDVLGYWVDENGEIVDHPLNRRVLAFPPGDLKAIPSVILVTGGVERHVAIRAALRKGIVDTVVTDEKTAALICARPYRGTEI